MAIIIDGTNGVSGVDGSAATPAVQGTDANTGLFFPAADTIAFTEGGAEAMRIDSSGNISVGVQTANARLELAKTSGVALRLNDLSTNYWELSNNSNLIFNRGGTERMRITSNGAIAFSGASSFGTSGQFLRSNGDAAPTWVTPSGGFTTMQIYTSGSGTWTIPSGITVCKITVVGGGGNGGTTTGSGLGQGGAGGGAAVKYYSGLTPGNTISYTVGGVAGTSSVSSGTQSITTMSATGGASGNGETTAGNGSFGSGSGGDINVSGGRGGGGGGGASGTGGFGGDSGLGFGIGAENIAQFAPPTSNSNGLSGLGYGAGGGGGFSTSTTSYSGGAGTGGIVIIEY